MSTSKTEKYIDTVTVTFDNALDESTGEVDTAKFLEASSTVVRLFDVLGPTAFAAVIKDMNGNIGKVKTRFEAAPEQSKTLQQLASEEYKEHKKKATATEGLMWLLRGHDFTAQAITHNLDNPDKELTESFNLSYGNTLKQHHNFLVKGIFTMALKATPYRKDFYETIGTADSTENHQKLVQWIKGLEKVVTIMQKYYADNGITF